MRNPAVIEALRALKVCTVADLLELHGTAVLDMSDAISRALMERLQLQDHLPTLAMCLAAVLAAMADMPCAGDVDGFVTTDDRMKIFLAQFRVFYADAVRINEQLKTELIATQHFRKDVH